MIEVWEKHSAEWAAKFASGTIVSAPDAKKLVAKFERAGVQTQPVRLVTGDGSSYTQYPDFAGFLLGVGKRAP